MDAALYFVRNGHNEELRYSLRSLHQAFPGLPVFIVGGMPDWCHPDGYLKGNHKNRKDLNVWDNLTLACAWDELPDSLLVMNDDMFITSPVDCIPTLYRGTLADHAASLRGRRDWWSLSIDHTARTLPTDALSYELHTPFPCSKQLLGEALDRDPGMYPPQWRTIYGNIHRIGGAQAKDVKVTRPGGTIPTPLASTSDVGFRFHRPWFEHTFTTPSPTEEGGPKWQPPTPTPTGTVAAN